jgi:dihydroorotate dehydrogenase
LEVEINGLTFKNPIIVGAAGYSEDKNGLERFIKRGYGGVVTKSTAEKSLAGAPPPRVFWYIPYTKTLLDGAEAHRGPGIKEVAESVKACKDLADREKCHIIGSVSCTGVEEGVRVAKEFQNAGVSALELDMQCPETGEHLGPEYSNRGAIYWADTKHPERSIELIKAVKKAVDVPVWPKIIPNSLYMMGENLEKEAGPDAFPYNGSSFPTYPLGITIDIENGRPLFNGNTLLKIQKKAKFMPITGCMPLLASTILGTAYLKRKLKAPLIPSGGVSRGLDVIQCFMAGASAVEVCTAIYKDMNVIESMVREIKWFMSKKGYNRLSEMAGIALDHVPYDLMLVPVRPLF